MEKLIGTSYLTRKVLLAKPSQTEVYVAKILEENGHKVFFTPENKAAKNYDAIIDGRLGEFKNPEKFKNIRKKLNEAEDQRASIVVITPPVENHTTNEAIREIRDWFETSQKPINHVDTVILIWGEIIKTLKKSPL